MARTEGKEKVHDFEFWEKLKRIDTMVYLIVHLLRIVDAMQPCIGNVYEAMDMIIEWRCWMWINIKYDEIHSLCLVVIHLSFSWNNFWTLSFRGRGRRVTVRSVGLEDHIGAPYT